jgi:hypothetical protein
MELEEALKDAMMLSVYASKTFKTPFDDDDDDVYIIKLQRGSGLQNLSPY